MMTPPCLSSLSHRTPTACAQMVRSRQQGWWTTRSVIHQKSIMCISLTCVERTRASLRLCSEDTVIFTSSTRNLQTSSLTRLCQNYQVGEFCFVLCKDTMLHHTYHTIPSHTIHTTLYHTLLLRTKLLDIIPHYVTPHYAMPYHTVSYHTLPYLTVPYHTSHHTIPNHLISYHTMSYHTIHYHTVSCCTLLFHA